ncbi:Dynamitin-domain-containing protein [Coniochaeta sp. 2T2.1]|nr:Dynamitin-domain-containing protein [Coniochaeta sp. 2T2.1]
MPASIDAQDVDFSDRLNSKRKSYKASSRRQRILEDGTEEYGELSDEDDGTNLERKLSRLRREVEEAKEQYAKQKAAAQQSSSEAAVHEGDFASLSEALSEISKESEGLKSGPANGAAGFKPPRQTATQEDRELATGDTATYTVTYAPSYEQTHALAKAADFDRRLVLLEKSLGIGSSAFPELDANGLPRAVLPTLETLQKQISTLSDASTSSLDTITRRVRTLTQEAENLEKARQNAKAAQEALASTGVAPQEGPDAEESEQTAKINALYGTLPTIENLAPLLPPLLDRLRSLRAIHADAATASETLARIDKRQTDMAGDINQRREGLEKVEAAMQQGEAAMGGNMKVVEGWVKELEAKVAKLS